MGKYSEILSAAFCLGLGLQGCQRQDALAAADAEAGPASALTAWGWRSANFPAGQSAYDIGAGGTNNRDILVLGTPYWSPYGWTAYEVMGPDNLESWYSIDGAGTRGDVGLDQRKFVIGYQGRLYVGYGGTWNMKPNPSGESGLSDVGVKGSDNNVIWALGKAAYVNSDSRKIYRSTNGGGAWTHIAGAAAKRIDVDHLGNAWIVGSDDQIRKYAGGTAWEAKGFWAIDVGAGAQGSVYALAVSSGVVHKYSGSGLAWDTDPFGTTGTNITVDVTGKPWVTRADGSVWTQY